MKTSGLWAALGGGIAFGFVLSRAGATTYDYYVELFQFTNPRLAWVIAIAAAVGALGVAALKRLHPNAVIGGGSIDFEVKPWRGTLIAGGLIFGLGWGGAGACPGTALAMLGEGKLGALFTIAGLTAGTWLYGLLFERSNGNAEPASGAS